MKNRLCIYIAFMVATASFIQACDNGENRGTSITSSSTEVYTCSMHPQVKENQPGKCPICGMKLIKMNVKPVAINNVDLETLLKPTNEYVVASLPVTTPHEGDIDIPVKAYGTIESDTRAAGTISSNVSGRIDKLYLRYRYQKIEAGQKVMDIYSPELLTAQENLLFLLKNDAQNTSFINASKQKLLLLGMGSTELNKVITSGKPLYSVGVYSKYAGHVHDAGMTHNMNETGVNISKSVTQELSLREGMYVEKGQTLFMIMNHHKAWVALQIFPNDLSFIKKGDSVSAVPETDTDAIIKGTIDFIEPFFRNNNKTITARVYFHNMDMLTVGSQVTASIYTGRKNGLWVPRTAVLTLGINEITFIKSEGEFKAHKITTGIHTSDKVQILSGLNITDTIATNAQYLADSESFIKANQ